MGLLVDGVWRDEQHDERAPTGRFLRPATRFRPAPAASPPHAGAIISMWRSPAPGRIAR